MLNPIKLASKNFLSSLDTSREEFLQILDIAKSFKNKDLKIELKDKVLGLIFDIRLSMNAKMNISHVFLVATTHVVRVGLRVFYFLLR